MTKVDNIHIAPVLQAEHNTDVRAKKVVPISPKGRSVSYESTSFAVGDSPAVLDVNSDLGRDGRDGYIANDGAGDIKVEISDDGNNYGGIHTLKEDEVLKLENVSIAKIRLTHVNDSSYRVFCI
jgi:hypothetical protein